MNKFALVLLALLAGSACQSKSSRIRLEKDYQVDSLVDLTETNIQKEIFLEKELEEFIPSVRPEKAEVILDFGFKVLLGGYGENLTYNECKLHTYTHIEIWKNDTIVYVNADDVEYEFGEKCILGYEFIYPPFVLQTGKGKYEILLPVNNRPWRGYLKRFFISDNEIVKRDSLPRFISSTAKYLSDDGIKKLAGFWYNVPGDEGYVGYCPIFYYSVTEYGIQLDSLLTSRKNEMIYEGYQHPIPLSNQFGYDSVAKAIYERFFNEVNRIINQ